MLVGVSALLGWPGGAESMQDLLTDRFTGPDVADPVPHLVRLNLYFWSWWLVQQLATPWLLAGWTCSAGALRWTRTPIWRAVVAVFLSGLLTQAGHPLTTQGDRLYVSSWLLVIIALPLVADRLAHCEATNEQPPDRSPAIDDTVVLPCQRIPEQQEQTRTGTPNGGQVRFNH